jgi:hypothetical protein
VIDEVTTAIATGAAGNLIAYMLNGRVDALRAHIARIFRHGSESERSTALNTLNDDVVALTQHEASKAEVSERWTDLIGSYLIAHPEARRDVEKFAVTFPGTRTTIIESQNNYDRGTFIGGDNYGDMTFGSQE